MSLDKCHGYIMEYCWWGKSSLWIVSISEASNRSNCNSPTNQSIHPDKRTRFKQEDINITKLENRSLIENQKRLIMLQRMKNLVL